MDFQPSFDILCSYENLELAFSKARRGKTLKPYIIEFEQSLKANLMLLRNELLFHTYKPKPLETFIIRDPKTRKISKSDFRDRVVHHAFCNIIEPLFDKQFIFDNYANRIGKGAFKAIERFDEFKRKVSKNNNRIAYILKADIKHYFDTVDHSILMLIIKRSIKDERILQLIKIILSNHNTTEQGKGMPLGNLTSQFLANVYLNELDQFIKHTLKAKYYIRYVDDFVILDSSKEVLEKYREKIDYFLSKNLLLQLHPDKSKILKLHSGILFLGFRIFYYHKLIRKKNIRKFHGKLKEMKRLHEKNLIEREKVIERFEGWLAYISHADTYKYKRSITKIINRDFPIDKKVQIINLKKHESFAKKVEQSNFQFSQQKTLQLLKKNVSIKDIALGRNIKEATVWEHIAQLIEFNQLFVYDVIQKEKAEKIKRCIRTEKDKLKEIMQKVNDKSVTFNEINCVLASVKARHRKKSIFQIIKWYKITNCYRKCYINQKQREICSQKFTYFASQNPTLAMKQKEFLDLFNNHMKICVLPEYEKRKYVSWKEFERDKTIIVTVKN
ncbi:helix-turn-helix domain-containing protein [Candidatus Woesearchaeota archaeon]|nr:helix-turn-helix domain-containing protein [Candidatus Woesearchaeota archaeon]